MSNYTSKVNIPPEGQTIEYKRSIFIDPVKQIPSAAQMRTIAATIAAFMNASGGELYVGVSDSHHIVGIEQDLGLLKKHPELVALKTVRHNDEDYGYGDTADKYQLKIRSIVKAYLSDNAQNYLGGVEFAKMDGLTVCRISVRKCRDDEVVYFYGLHGSSRVEVAEIYKRFGNEKRLLKGTMRDEFIRDRTICSVNRVLFPILSMLPKDVLSSIKHSQEGSGVDTKDAKHATEEVSKINESVSLEGDKGVDGRECAKRESVYDGRLFRLEFNYGKHAMEVRYNRDIGGDAEGFSLPKPAGRMKFRQGRFKL